LDRRRGWPTPPPTTHGHGCNCDRKPGRGHVLPLCSRCLRCDPAHKEALAALATVPTADGEREHFPARHFARPAPIQIFAPCARFCADIARLVISSCRDGRANTEATSMGPPPEREFCMNGANGLLGR